MIRALVNLASVAAFAAFCGAAHASAMFATTAPTIDGVVSPGEWAFAQTEFDTGARPNGAANAGGTYLSGARGTFAWDNTYVYGLIEAYPNTGTPSPGENANGPFDNFNWEVYINGLGFPAAVFLDTTSGATCNGGAGTMCVFGTTDPVDTGNSFAHMVLEFKIPIVNIVDSTGGNLPNPYMFDPAGGDFLEYRVATSDPDAAGGFDSTNSTGWVTEPPETSGGYRRLDFAAATPLSEPTSITLFGASLIGFGALRRRRASIAAEV